MQVVEKDEWGQFAHMFEPDGSLRDIVVYGTGVADCQKLLDLIRREFGTSVRRTSGLPLPADAADLFAESGDAILFEKSGILFKYDIISPELIEIDLDPRAVTSSEQFEAIRNFMSKLSGVVKKDAFLTEEGDRGDYLLKVGTTS